MRLSLVLRESQYSTGENWRLPEENFFPSSTQETECKVLSWYRYSRQATASWELMVASQRLLANSTHQVIVLDLPIISGAAQRALGQVAPIGNRTLSLFFSIAWAGQT